VGIPFIFLRARTLSKHVIEQVGQGNASHRDALSRDLLRILYLI
jgi:hypothetical protein